VTKFVRKCQNRLSFLLHEAVIDFTDRLIEIKAIRGFRRLVLTKG
jgi:hypothetical protein